MQARCGEGESPRPRVRASGSFHRRAGGPNIETPLAPTVLDGYRINHLESDTARPEVDRDPELEYEAMVRIAASLLPNCFL